MINPMISEGLKEVGTKSALGEVAQKTPLESLSTLNESIDKFAPKTWLDGNKFSPDLNTAGGAATEVPYGQKSIDKFDSYKEAVASLRVRMEEMGISGVKEQDQALQETCSKEIVGEFRKEVSDEKLEQLNHLENATPLSLEELKEKCPELYNQIEKMNKRLGNDCEDGIMNTLRYAELENGDIVAYSTNDMYSNSKMVYSDGTVYAKSGGAKGSDNLNEFINTAELMPETTYCVDGRSMYETDNQGRVEKVTTVVTDTYEEKLDRGQDQQEMIRQGKGAIEDDESCHFVPYCLGGPNEAINQAPMLREINRGEGSEWRTRENDLKKATDAGSTSWIEQHFSYEGDSKRPSTIEYGAEIDGEKQETLTFNNKVS